MRLQKETGICGSTEKKKKFSRHKPDMIQLLELTDRSFSITAITMGKIVVKKMGNICKQIEIFSREMESIKKNQMEIVALKKCDTKIEAFIGYIQKKTEYKRRID